VDYFICCASRGVFSFIIFAPYLVVMKKITAILFLLSVAYALSAQPVVAYWDSIKGIKKSEMNFKDGMQHGPFKLWYKDGKLAEQGFFKYGYQDSIWKNFYETGKLKAIKSFKRGQPDGKCIFFFTSGDSAEVDTYDYGKKDGRWQTWYENGQVSAVTPYKNDLKEGEWIYYYDNGNIQNRGTFVHDKKDGHYTAWSADGKKQMEGDFSKNKETGKCQEWYVNGQLKSVTTHADTLVYLMEYNDSTGKKIITNGNGTLTVYYPDKKVEAKGNYANGLKDGLWKFYKKDGYEDYEAVFANGRMNGDYK
jgi:antitoxin component YwqK of YwqJK toxin-antitoxin module